MNIEGRDHLSCYRFGSRFGGHSFCSYCGVSVLNQLNDPDVEIEIQPVNLRVLNGVPLDGMKIQKANGRAVDPAEMATAEGRQRTRAKTAEFLTKSNE